MAKRQRFTKEFKLEAVWLWQSSGWPAAAVARELGLRRNHLYNWQTKAETRGGGIARQGRPRPQYR